MNKLERCILFFSSFCPINFCYLLLVISMLFSVSSVVLLLSFSLLFFSSFLTSASSSSLLFLAIYLHSCSVLESVCWFILSVHSPVAFHIYFQPWASCRSMHFESQCPMLVWTSETSCINEAAFGCANFVILMGYTAVSFRAQRGTLLEKQHPS